MIEIGRKREREGNLRIIYIMTRELLHKITFSLNIISKNRDFINRSLV